MTVTQLSIAFAINTDKCAREGRICARRSRLNEVLRYACKRDKVIVPHWADMKATTRDEPLLFVTRPKSPYAAETVDRVGKEYQKEE